VQEEGRVQAQAEAETMLARARSEIQLERDNAIAELRKEFADITVQAAEKVIGQSLDKSSHQKLIEEVLADSNLQETRG
jgi:F-type H+-transporting ATPase subunit b